MKLRAIQILEKDNNKKGDLFGRLMGDLFHTFGYDEPRLNIHKSGREIDLQAEHRIEKKIALAECKAHNETIGGADINKFIGVVDAEKRKIKKDKRLKDFNIVAYFISVSGFKETAIEQEDNIGNARVILVKPEKIVDELVKGRILVSKEQAIVSQKKDSNLTLINYVDLIAHSRGWIWVLYYSDSHRQNVSHFSLIHAEGNPLIKSIAEEIVEKDKAIDNLFDGLISLNSVESFSERQLLASKNRYFSYLNSELGEMHFEGLPTDKEAGAVKVKLENIFVPLHLIEIPKEELKDKQQESSKRLGIGRILASKSKLAILAKPGGGKSTLIKRIAIAYAFPERRTEINDQLPDKPWFPIFLRCRELGEKVLLSITEIINTIPTRAEISSSSQDFSILVSNSLQSGNALLLIDGLDEIAEDKNRIAFVNQLRTFIATYPTINIIVTSREAGFRAVGGSLATYCDHYKVSNLIESEINELSIKWHKAIIDNSENTIKEARKLSELIIKDVRIKVLAENPLLLTTLLFVKRWAGYLPTKKTVLYQEMIKLLLVTWNVEGHTQIDIEEAEPQLAYVAYWMTENGLQTISEDDLKARLIDARSQMPEILGYTNVSPSEFIKRVEFRSSLLIMSGHKRLTSGQVTQVYEFLHLSFQEYLTAKAIVKRYIPLKDAKKKTIDLLKPNISNEFWKEVIPITAVLLERETKELIEYLISESKITASKSRDDEDSLAPFLLGSCLANEIQISPELLGTALEWYSKNTYKANEEGPVTETILKTKFGSLLRAKVKELFFVEHEDKYLSNLGSVLSEIYRIDLGTEKIELIMEDVGSVLVSDRSREEKVTAILGLMVAAFNRRNYSDNDYSLNGEESFYDVYSHMYTLLITKDTCYQFSICWCIAWSVDAGLFPNKLRQDYVVYLAEVWINPDKYNLRRVVSWALSKLMLPSINSIKLREMPKLRSAIFQLYEKPLNEFDKIASIFFAKLIDANWEKEIIRDFFRSEIKEIQIENHRNSNLYQFAKSYGIDLEALNLEVKK